MSNQLPPTRADFLADGLAPVPATELLALSSQDRDCAICSEELSDPVKLHCGHVFDRPCVTSWLKMPGKATCPTCRRVLFSTPLAHPTNPVAERSQLIYRALRAAGLAIDGRGQIDLFGVSNLSPSNMARASPAAAQYLIFSTAPGQAQQAGPSTVRADVLGAHLVTMGNLIPSLAELQGRPYSQRHRDDWRAVLSRLCNVLADRDGAQYDALTMPHQLRRALVQSLQGSGVMADELDFFDSENPLSTDLNTLLSYLTQIAWQTRIDDDRKKQQAARRAAEQVGAAALLKRERRKSGRQQCLLM